MLDVGLLLLLALVQLGTMLCTLLGSCVGVGPEWGAQVGATV